MNSNIKILKGPYSDVWRDAAYDSKEWSDSLYDLIMWGCEITWDAGTHWIVASLSKDYRKWYEEYRKYGMKPDYSAIVDVNSAIDLYKLKHSLTPKTQQTFNDLINEL
jgi:hypothetical protein